MAFTNYTIVPSDGVVVIDGIVYTGVDMTGIPVHVHAIQWYGLRSQGVIEYKVDPETGVLPAQGSFTDPTTYQTQLYAAEDPLIAYATADNTTYEGYTYMQGEQLIIRKWPNPAVPAGFTTTVILGELGAFQTWQWDGSTWVASSFPIELNLVGAKTYLRSRVDENVKSLVNHQARNYSIVQLFDAPSVRALLPADSALNGYPTLGDFQDAAEAEAAPLIAQINAATAKSQLFDFDPTVPVPPNY
jgi:hypothetical protein